MRSSALDTGDVLRLRIKSGARDHWKNDINQQDRDESRIRCDSFQFLINSTTFFFRTNKLYIPTVSTNHTPQVLCFLSS